MSEPFEIEYRNTRAQWHLEMALSATNQLAADAHSELARRYFSDDEPIDGSERVQAT